MLYNNILMIDDDEDDRDIFLSVISELSTSIVCSTISTANEALTKLEKKELTPDVIFLDLNLPIMSGEEFLAEIKRRPTLKNIPVIIFSTSSNASIAKQTRELGAAAFITKPNSYQELINILKPLIKH